MPQVLALARRVEPDGARGTRRSSARTVTSRASPFSTPRIENSSRPGEAERLAALAGSELQRQDPHHQQVRAVDPLVALGDHGASRRAATAPSRPSRATSPSRTPCRRARSAACLGEVALGRVRRSSSPRRSARAPSTFPRSRARAGCCSRTFANVPRTITSWLPRRAPYELKSARSTPCSVR